MFVLKIHRLKEGGCGKSRHIQGAYASAAEVTGTVYFSLGLSWHTHTGSNIGVTLKVTLPRPPLSFGVALWGYV